ncbi:MAG: hypothetical protein OXI10_05275 [Gammaproteobacteria bacterium]|nr:hypothetical protein [Gammaproteobacteria bacterium]
MISRSANKATKNLLKWAERPEWSMMQLEVYRGHLVPVSEVLGIPEVGIPATLGEASVMLNEFIMEDFFSARFDGDGEVNVIDDYLKRRGWRESVPGRRYLEAMKDSVPSVYEVVELDPGRGMKLKDLVRGGTVAVRERAATDILGLWDCLAARVVRVNGEHYLTGGSLPFSRGVSRELVNSLEEAIRETTREIRRELRKRHGKSKKIPAVTREMALDRQPMAQMLSTSWTIAALVAQDAPMPELRNTDDEPILFCEVRFALRGDMAAVSGILDSIPVLERSDGRDTPKKAGQPESIAEWDWLAPEDPGYRSLQLRKGKELPEEITGDTGEKIGVTRLGHLVLGPERLVLTTNSKERGERGRVLLVSRLGELVGRAVVSYGDPAKAMEGMDAGKRPEEEEIPMPPEEVQQAIHAQLDRHYHRVLDEPVPMLGGKTPREAAKGRGRSRGDVVEWLKGLENVEHRRSRSAGHAAYDTGWMWKELRIRKPG